ncbi:ATP-binding protein [Streptomyces sp. CHD11]|uniref:ATP-binding protein n=1 Tax=Streptomyces sp. CHD11 TaxID=2741325 RepID=UPI001BFCCC68|nr:ATP-binding protein [Streptomyces sp. CHD11]MBT3150824.1 ATP-binding protein [Streptomyces sp. CHD11]
MSVPASPSQHQPVGAPRTSFAVPSVVLVTSAAAGGAALALAPSGTFTWALTVVVAAWVFLAVTVLAGHRLVHRARVVAARHEAEKARLGAESARRSAEISQLAGATLPVVAERLREGAGASEVLAGMPPQSDPQLRRLAHAFATAVEEDVRRAAALDGDYRTTRHELERTLAELHRLTQETMPVAVARLRDGRSADTVLAEVELPGLPALRTPAEAFVRELAHSERRAAAAQAASAKALSRVQAKAVRMLADLRDMQERHGEEVFGDLLKLDHSTSQLGLMTDRLALLMGGRSSRAWNKPIVMESILRGAVGRIAAYQRVRLHCSTRAAVSGFAAEGVMHLLAELMDNAANFSPPIDEVHVYVEDRSAGIVVTIEDSGLKMADAAMRRAEESVAGRVTDLASLQGTRLGLAVVGRLAAKYGISVNYRPSSRGGTGVVVLLPLDLLAQQRDMVPHETVLRPAAPAARAPAAPAPVPAPAPDALPGAPARTAAAEPPATTRWTAGAQPPSGATEWSGATHRADTMNGAAAMDRPAVGERPAVEPGPPDQGRHRRPDGTTPNGLPVRAPGRTMAEAEREREQRQQAPGRTGDVPAARRPARDAGSRFGAFHRARRSGNGDGTASGPGARPAAEPGTPPEAGSGTPPEAGSGASAEAGSGARPEAGSGARPRTAPDAYPGTAPDARAEAQPPTAP